MLRTALDSATQKRVQRETDAHDSNSVLENSYRLKNRFSHIWSYPSRNELRRHLDETVSRMNGCSVLDYGCGWGEDSARYLQAGASVSGIDISQRLVESARQRAAAVCQDADRYCFEVMDAHKLSFADASFDFVIGNGILHHLNQSVALREVYRVLRPGGEAMFLEPLADNPLLKVFRLLTPSARTKDERPLKGSDLLKYAAMLPWKSRHEFCGLVEAPVAMLTSLLMPRQPHNLLLALAHRLETFLSRHGALRAWNQYVLLVFSKTP